MQQRDDVEVRQQLFGLRRLQGSAGFKTPYSWRRNRRVGNEAGSHCALNDDIDTLTGRQGVDGFLAKRLSKRVADPRSAVDKITDQAAREFWNDAGV